jgi:hypothetical protein
MPDDLTNGADRGLLAAVSVSLPLAETPGNPVMALAGIESTGPAARYTSAKSRSASSGRQPRGRVTISTAKNVVNERSNPVAKPTSRASRHDPHGYIWLSGIAPSVLDQQPITDNAPLLIDVPPD